MENYKWSTAKKYCSKLKYAGKSDWRLPTISELKTLIKGCQSRGHACEVDDSCLSLRECRSSKCYCDKHEGRGEKGFYWKSRVWNYDSDIYGVFWSSSRASDDSDKAWLVSFSDAHVDYDSKNVGHYVRCVRGGK